MILQDAIAELEKALATTQARPSPDKQGR